MTGTRMILTFGPQLDLDDQARRAASWFKHVCVDWPKHLFHAEDVYYDVFVRPYVEAEYADPTEDREDPVVWVGPDAESYGEYIREWSVC